METALQISGAGFNQIQAGTAYNWEELRTRFIMFIDRMPQTVRTYSEAIRGLVSYFKENAITTPGRPDIIAYKKHMTDAGKAPATVSLAMTATRLFFQWLDSEGLYKNIAANIHGLKLDTEHKKGYLSADQVKKVLSTTEGDKLAEIRDRAIIALMVTTGIRRIAVQRANIKDLSFLGDTPILKTESKGHSEHGQYVKIPAPVDKAIRDYLTARGETDRNAPLFTSASNRGKGERLTTRSISRLVKGHLNAAGLDPLYFSTHSLRHTAATLNLKNGATLEETQQLLQHKDINTTMIYSHALEREKNNSEMRIAAAIF